jgi:hypothetical protein
LRIWNISAEARVVTFFANPRQQPLSQKKRQPSAGAVAARPGKYELKGFWVSRKNWCTVHVVFLLMHTHRTYRFPGFERL